MAFTTASEISFINQVLDRIAAGQITLASQTSVEALAAYRHWQLTLDSLIRSFTWPFLTDRATLYPMKTLLLDVEPTSAFSVGDTITGITSGVTAEIYAVTSNTEYQLIYTTGDFTDGETITNGTVEVVYWEGIEVDYDDKTVIWWDGSSASQANLGTGYPSVTNLQPLFGFTYQYYLPDDFARLISVYEEWGTDLPDDRWKREGQRILTNYTTCNVIYVKKVTDPDDFDELFAELLLLKMAKKLIPAIPGTKSKTLVDEINEDLKDANRRARIVCLQEDNQSGRSNWNLARYGT